MVTNTAEPLVAMTTCPICGRLYGIEVTSETLKEFYEEHPQVCPAAECQARQAEKQDSASREREIAEAKRRALDDLGTRLEESNLNHYELGFDLEHPQANRALAAWMVRNIDHCVWVYGPTGRCKTRVVQHAARMAIQDRSVRYWPAFDLGARLTETSKRPEAQLKDIYFADLLILDDLGITNMTEARLSALASIVDRRYIGWDQVRRAQGGDSPVFGWSAYGRRRALGGQIWITSQVPPDELITKLATINATDAAALVRRLADMCVIHEAEVTR